VVDFRGKVSPKGESTLLIARRRLMFFSLMFRYLRMHLWNIKRPMTFGSSSLIRI
jgi:hypothetical protein